MSSSDTMSRRVFVSSGASLLAAGAALMIQPKAFGATPDSGHESMHGTASKEGTHHSPTDMQRCIDLCHECHALCNQTIAHCLKLGGSHAAHDHIQLFIDCAQMCMITADYLTRESVIHDRVCRVCADACRLCAESCEMVAGENQLLKRCADMCRRCADSCVSMGSNAV
jgi:hypothetical protein